MQPSRYPGTPRVLLMCSESGNKNQFQTRVRWHTYFNVFMRTRLLLFSLAAFCGYGITLGSTSALAEKRILTLSGRIGLTYLFQSTPTEGSGNYVGSTGINGGIDFSWSAKSNPVTPTNHCFVSWVTPAVWLQKDISSARQSLNALVALGMQANCQWDRFILYATIIAGAGPAQIGQDSFAIGGRVFSFGLGPRVGPWSFLFSPVNFSTVGAVERLNVYYSFSVSPLHFTF